ncbi:hypothetical protein HOY82DRAFT_556063 [Tuber indicum]|nr:hypothetical protein HOY82DRAFT_556063 [Tuber indicum]
MNAVKIEEPSPASSRLHAKRKAAAMEESITLSATSPIEIDITPAAVPRKRGKRNAKDEVTIQGDTGLGLGITKSSVAARNRGVRRNVTELEGVVANGQEAGPPPAAGSTAGKANTIPQDAATGPLTSINADAAPAQEGTTPAADGGETQKEMVNIPEVGATPEAGSATTAEKPALVPAAGSPGSEVALPKEHSTNAAVSGTSVAADPAPPPPPPPVRRPRYRTPRPGTRKSKRTNPDPEPEPKIPE